MPASLRVCALTLLANSLTISSLGFAEVNLGSRRMWQDPSESLRARQEDTIDILILLRPI